MRAVLSKEGEVVGDGGGGDRRAMLVATAMLGVASEGSKKELREWGSTDKRKQERGRRSEIAGSGDTLRNNRTRY